MNMNMFMLKLLRPCPGTYIETVFSVEAVSQVRLQSYEEVDEGAVIKRRMATKTADHRIRMATDRYTLGDGHRIANASLWMWHARRRRQPTASFDCAALPTRDPNGGLKLLELYFCSPRFPAKRKA